MHHRHLRPWELFVDDDESCKEMPTSKSSVSFDSLSSNNASNLCNSSWEDEPWVAKYEKRNFVQKVFDRQVWIEEPALRGIQDTIFVQSVLFGTITACVIVGVFMAVPRGNYF